jgi:hypothetical protein
MRVLAGHEIIKLQYSLQSHGEETGALLTYYILVFVLFSSGKIHFFRNKDVLTTVPWHSLYKHSLYMTKFIRNKIYTNIIYT